MKSTLYTAGKIIFALTIAFFGIGHLTNASAMSGMIPSMLSSFALPLVYLTGVCLLLAAVSIIINKFTTIACILLAVFLLLIILTVHVPHLPDQSAMAMVIKDSAMMAASLMIAGNSKS